MDKLLPKESFPLQLNKSHRRTRTRVQQELQTSQLYDAPDVGEKSGMGMDLAVHESILKGGRPVVLGSEDGQASEGET